MKILPQPSLRVTLESCPEGFRWTFPAMGTTWEIIIGEVDRDTATHLLRLTVQWVHGFEARYSRFRPDSLISQINDRAGTGEWTFLSRADQTVFLHAQEIVFNTDGLIDPTALPLSKLWDYRCLRTTLPTEEEIEHARSLVSWSAVERGPLGVRLRHPGMGLDFGGFGKELAVDQIARVVAGHGIRAGLVNGGGDISVIGTPTDKPCWHIALENPDDGATEQQGLGVRDGAVASSGHHRRCFEYQGKRYSHLIDPRHGRPSTSSVRAASILAPTCLQAGILATSACLLEPAEALRKIEQTPLAEGGLFTPNGFRATAGLAQYTTLTPILS